MAGDSDSRLENEAENEHVNRQPFLIGVAGGTASGKLPWRQYLPNYAQKNGRSGLSGATPMQSRLTGLSPFTNGANTPISTVPTDDPFRLAQWIMDNWISLPRLVQSSVCGKIMELLGQNKIDHHQRQVAILSQDSFYRVLTPEQKAKVLKGQYNFDHPDAFDNELIMKTLWDIMEGKAVQIPVYDFVTHSRKEESVTVYPADVVLFEGILMFYSLEIREMFHMKLFVDTDADTRLSRRVLRDITERGRDLEQILTQYITFVKPAFEEFCLPTKKYADVIIPRGADNLVAINLIVQHIQDILNGGLTKRQQNGCVNGLISPRQRKTSESSSRPH